MNQKPFVSIVVCTHNRADALDKYALKSISGLDYPDYEVIVIDDASTDGTREITTKYHGAIRNLKYVLNQKHKTLCHVRNLGVEHSTGEIIAFTDDDCCVEKDWLDELVRPYAHDADMMCVGGKIYRRDTEAIQRYGKITGCNMSFRRTVFDRFSFDTNLKYSHYHDELDLLHRIKSKNLKIMYNERAVLRHFVEPAAYREATRIGGKLNQIYYHAKHVSTRDYYYRMWRFFNSGNTPADANVDDSDNYETDDVSRLERANTTGINKALYKAKREGVKLPAYQVLVEIPLKARLKHWQEERIFRRGTSRSRAADGPPHKS